MKGSGLDEEANKAIIVLKQQIMLVDLCEEESAKLTYMFRIQLSGIYCNSPKYLIMTWSLHVHHL
jgi:hypothetical protein